MMKIREVSDTEEFNALKYKWNRLLKKSKSDNIFLTHQWLNTWWKYFSKGKELKIILVEEGNDKLVGIAPLMLEKFYSQKRLKFIGEPHSDYHDFILLSGEEKRILGAILKYLHSSLDWDVMQLKEIPQDSKTLKVLDESSLYLKRNTVQSPCPVLKLPESWDDLLNNLSKRMRRKLRNDLNRLNNKFQVNYEKGEKNDLLKKNMEVLFELHQKEWTERGLKGVFVDSLIKDFLMDVAQQFYDHDWLQLRILKVNEAPVSIYYNFKYNKKNYCYLSAIDPNCSKYSVGTVLLVDCIKSAIHDGCTEFDFMRGAEDYKKRWKTQNKYNFRLELVNDRLYSKVKYKIFRVFAELYSPIKEKHVLIAFKKVGNYSRQLIKSYIFLNRKLIMYRKSLKNSLSTLKPEIEVRFCMANQEDITKLVNVMGLISPKAIEQKFKNGELCFVAKKGEEIIHYSWICFGSLYINEIEKEERFGDSTPFIYNVFTLPQYRGEKIYPYVLSQEFKYLAQEGHSYVYIHTLANNKPSIQGIKRAGFEIWQIIRYIKIFGIKKYKILFRRHF